VPDHCLSQTFQVAFLRPDFGRFYPGRSRTLIRPFLPGRRSAGQAARATEVVVTEVVVTEVVVRRALGSSGLDGAAASYVVYLLMSRASA
jgi:hypothetical protein